MADDVLMTYGNEDEISDVLNKIERPVHEAICLGKILCPTDECIAQRAYFHESGVVHHLRVKHKKEFSMSDRNKSICVSRQIHERETRACIEKIFEYRKAKNANGYQEVTVTSAGRTLACIVKDELEAVKLMCLLLYYGGILKQYSEGNKSCDVDVVREGLQAKFHCWYIDQKDQSAVSFQTECFFVKRNHRSNPDVQFDSCETSKTPNADTTPHQFSGDPLVDILQNVFHHEKFKGMQRQVIDQITSNKDTLTIMPTGGGKSICYWVPGLASMGVTVVITPLVALLNDQVAKLKNYGINVCYVNSSMLPQERDSIFHELTKEISQYKFFYLTPESALTPQVKACFEAMVSNKTLSRFVIDEAHCIDTWGQSFRPSYSCLSQLKQFGVPVVAFTGTATTQTKERIIEKLGLVEPTIIQSTCNRPNLVYTVLPKGGPHPKEDLVHYIQQNFSNMSGIVYCLSTKDTIELAYILKSKGLSAVYYHGQLDYFEKTENAKDWLLGKALVMCATSAFGMGIDKANVRFVIHLSIPKSLEEYYQEAGRGGRDGQKSHCVIMFRFEDRTKCIQLISSTESDDHKEHQQRSLDAVVSYCMSSTCRRKFIMEYFDDNSTVQCEGSCDNCLKPPSVPKDYTNEAIKLCYCVEEMSLMQRLM